MGYGLRVVNGSPIDTFFDNDGHIVHIPAEYESQQNTPENRYILVPESILCEIETRLLQIIQRVPDKHVDAVEGIVNMFQSIEG